MVSVLDYGQTFKDSIYVGGIWGILLSQGQPVYAYVVSSNDASKLARYFLGMGAD